MSNPTKKMNKNSKKLILSKIINTKSHYKIETILRTKSFNSLLRWCVVQNLLNIRYLNGE